MLKVPLTEMGIITPPRPSEPHIAVVWKGKMQVDQNRERNRIGLMLSAVSDQKIKKPIGANLYNHFK